MVRSLATLVPGALITAYLAFVVTSDPAAGGVFAALLAAAIALIVLGTEKPGTWALYGAFLTAPMEDLRPGPESLLTLSDLLLGIGMLLLLPTLMRRPLNVPTPVLVGIALILPTVAIASLSNPDSARLLVNGTRLLLAVIVVPLAMLWWRPELRQLIPLAWAYVLGHVISTGYAVIEGDLGNSRYDGLTTHPNFFGHCGLVAVCLLIFLLQHTHSRRWLLVLPAAISAASIAMSGSRASALVAVMVVVLYPVLERSVVAAYLLAASVLGGLLLSSRLAEWLDRPSLDFLARFRGDATTEVSDQERTEVLYDGLDRFLARPLLGNGFDDLGLQAHNIYLQVAVGIGIFGLIGFGLIMATALRALTQAGDLYRLGYVAFAYASVGMLTNSLWDRFMWLPMALALVAYASATRSQRDEEAISASNLSATSESANSRSASLRAR